MVQESGHGRTVFPTPVGVFPTLSVRLPGELSLPHARGGVSFVSTPATCVSTSSPRPWGCFSLGDLDTVFHAVFPTPVGVFLWRRKVKEDYFRLPHARGGVSLPVCGRALRLSSSPRPWGCFSAFCPHASVARVFPTPVGVFLCVILNHPLMSSLPHARGGVSTDICSKAGYGLSSPRPWGCFSFLEYMIMKLQVFPTPVGVFHIWK